MSFKEQLQTDAAIFFNVDEFAEEQELGFAQDDGTYLTVKVPVLTEDTETTYTHNFAPELGIRHEKIHVPTAHLPENVSINVTVLWKGETWSVNKCVENNGVTLLELMVL